MRTTISLFTLSGILFVGSAGAAIAQNNAQDAPSSTPDMQAGSMHGPGGHHAPNPDMEVKHLTKKLSLTADQQSQIKPILDDRMQQMQALRSDTTMARSDKFAKMKSIHEDSDSKITAVLNDKQKQQYQQMKDEHQAHMQEHRHEGQAPGGDAPQAPPQ